MTNSKEINSDEDLATPLLCQDEQNEDPDEALEQFTMFFAKIKRCSFQLGFVIGIFVQLSTLGSNFLLIAVIGKSGFETGNHQREAFVFSMVWSCFTSLLALLVLSLIRVMALSILRLSPSALGNGEEGANNLVMHMECRFVVGALIGVCLAWCVSDLLLGMQSLALYSLGTLTAAMIWCKAVLSCFSATSSSSDEHNEQEEKIALVV